MHQTGLPIWESGLFFDYNRRILNKKQDFFVKSRTRFDKWPEMPILAIFC